MNRPREGDIVYTKEGAQGRVQWIIGFINAKADGNPEWWYVTLQDGSTVRIVRLGEGGPWQVERRLM